MNLLKELLPLTEGKTPDETYVVALVNRNGAIKGYFAADDQDLVQDINKAIKYNAFKKAESNAKINNDQWDMKSQFSKFVPKKVMISYKIVESVKVATYSLDEEITVEESINESFGHSDDLWDSSEFESEFNKLEKLLGQAQAKLDSHAWIEYMKVTDSNYSTEANEMSKGVKEKLDEAIEALEALYDHLVEAS
jgi:hypothetical protein